MDGRDTSGSGSDRDPGTPEHRRKYAKNIRSTRRTTLSTTIERVYVTDSDEDIEEVFCTPVIPRPINAPRPDADEERKKPRRLRIHKKKSPPASSSPRAGTSRSFLDDEAIDASNVKPGQSLLKPDFREKNKRKNRKKKEAKRRRVNRARTRQLVANDPAPTEEIRFRFRKAERKQRASIREYVLGTEKHEEANKPRVSELKKQSLVVQSHRHWEKSQTLFQNALTNITAIETLLKRPLIRPRLVADLRQSEQKALYYELVIKHKLIKYDPEKHK